MRRGPQEKLNCCSLVSSFPGTIGSPIGISGSSERSIGAGESGKSTVLKQMRLIYAQGFSKAEKEEWRAIIFNNLLSAFKVILDAMDELDIEFDVKLNDVSNYGSCGLRSGACAD
jgi:G-protein alpha subunit